jgi:peroxiredoxin
MARILGWCKLVVGAAAAVLTASCQDSRPPQGGPGSPAAPRVGALAPDFEGIDLTGERFKLSEQRGKVVLVSFWFSACSPCRMMFPIEKAIVKRFKGDPFVLIGVNVDRSQQELQRTVENEGLTWRNLWDGSGTIAGAYEVNGFPTIFLIDHQGKIIDTHIGLHKSPRDLEDAISQAMRQASR